VLSVVDCLVCIIEVVLKAVNIWLLSALCHNEVSDVSGRRINYEYDGTSVPTSSFIGCFVSVQ
jgi:hypothetical protein